MKYKDHLQNIYLFYIYSIIILEYTYIQWLKLFCSGIFYENHELFLMAHGRKEWAHMQMSLVGERCDWLSLWGKSSEPAKFADLFLTPYYNTSELSKCTKFVSI